MLRVPIVAQECSSCRLASVVQWFPHGFYYQTDEAIGDGICQQNSIEANRVMYASDRNWAGYDDKRPNIAHVLAGRWESGCGVKCPKTRA